MKIWSYETFTMENPVAGSLFLMFKCQLSIPTIVEVSLKRLFGKAVVIRWSLLPKSYWRHRTSIFMHTRHPKGGRLRHSWTTIFGLLSFLLFLWSRCVYSMFRHVRRLSPLFSLACNWNRAHVTFGCYLITIKLYILFLEQSCVFIPINPSLHFKCA